MDWITPKIAVGNVEDALLIDDPPHPVDSVLCLSGFPKLSHLPDIRWFGVPLIDGPGNQPDQFLQALGFIHRELAAERRVLVHCMEGRSRSVLMVALYLAVADGHRLDVAIELVGACRKVAAVDPGLFGSIPDSWRSEPSALYSKISLRTGIEDLGP